MTNEATPAVAGAEAQPQADANSVDSIIDNALAEQNNATKDQAQSDAAEPQESEAEAEQLWPKKATNALSRRDKQIGKLKAQTEYLAQENEKLRAQSTQKQPIEQVKDGRPDEKNYDNYADYMKAELKWEMEQKFAERDTKNQKTVEQAREEAWVAERQDAAASKAKELVKDIPDLVDFVGEHEETYEAFSPEIKRAFLESDNPLLAAYNLVKEGKFEALASMSPARAAMEIGRAQAQAIAKPKTNAPKPMPAARGAVAGSKRLEDMDGDEIRQFMRAK